MRRLLVLTLSARGRGDEEARGEWDAGISGVFTRPPEGLDSHVASNEAFSVRSLTPTRWSGEACGERS